MALLQMMNMPCSTYSMGKLVRHEKVSGRWPASDGSLVDADELFESLVDCNDVILESAVSPSHPLYILQLVNCVCVHNV